jgi:hypothetical protein
MIMGHRAHLANLEFGIVLAAESLRPLRNPLQTLRLKTWSFQMVAEIKIFDRKGRKETRQ